MSTNTTARSTSSGATIGCGGMGICLAIVISYTANHSVGWAVVHGILGWFYVIFRLIVGLP